jgi:hypothetical protein
MVSEQNSVYKKKGRTEDERFRGDPVEGYPYMVNNTNANQ